MVLINVLGCAVFWRRLCLQDFPSIRGERDHRCIAADIFASYLCILWMIHRVHLLFHVFHPLKLSPRLVRYGNLCIHYLLSSTLLLCHFRSSSILPSWHWPSKSVVTIIIIAVAAFFVKKFIWIFHSVSMMVFPLDVPLVRALPYK